MAYKVKVNRYTRRRPMSPRMQELLNKMGVKTEVTIESHERAFTPRRRPVKKPDPEEE
jgi:hypothetical protein